MTTITIQLCTNNSWSECPAVKHTVEDWKVGMAIARAMVKQLNTRARVIELRGTEYHLVGEELTWVACRHSGCYIHPEA